MGTAIGQCKMEIYDNGTYFIVVKNSHVQYVHWHAINMRVLTFKWLSSCDIFRL